MRRGTRESGRPGYQGRHDDGRGEEALLAMDLAAAGWNLAYVPELVAHHLPAPDGRDPRARRRVKARNQVLTAASRCPAPTPRRPFPPEFPSRRGPRPPSWLSCGRS